MRSKRTNTLRVLEAYWPLREYGTNLLADKIMSQRRFHHRNRMEVRMAMNASSCGTDDNVIIHRRLRPTAVQ